MSDSEAHNAESELSSIHDGDSIGEESLDEVVTRADGDQEPSDRIYRESDEQSRTASQVAKAIEAAEDHRPSTPIAGASQPPYISAAGQTSWEDDAPILDAGPAPPDYFAATAWRRDLQSNPAERLDDASSMRQDAISAPPRLTDPEAVPYLQPIRQVDLPTDSTIEIGEDSEADELYAIEQDERTPLLGQGFTNTNSSRKARSRAVCLGNNRPCWINCIGIVAVVVLVGNLLAWFQGQRTFEIAKHPDKHGDPAVDHRRTAECEFNSYSDYLDIELRNATSFSLLEDIDFLHDTELENIVVTGNLEIIYVPQNSSITRHSSILVRIHMATVLPWRVESMENTTYHTPPNEIICGRPHLQKSTIAGKHSQQAVRPPCLDVLIVVYVQEGTVLERWDTSLFNLNFTDHEAAMRHNSGAAKDITHINPKVWVANQTDIYCEHGDIDISHWNSNDTRIGAVEGSIAGTVLQHNKTHICSDGGNIDVWISPGLIHQHGNPSNSEFVQYEQRLSTESERGNIYVRFLQPRAHQEWAEVGTHSFGTRKPATTASASFRDGPGGSGSLGSLISFHQSTSGSVTLAYPSAWSGAIAGLTRYGNISVSGDDIEFLPEEDHGGLTLVKARKGIGDSFLVFQSWSGQGMLHIGDDE